MTLYHENRTYSCWICKYFVQNEEEYCNGFCVGNSPKKIDYNVGETGAIVGAPVGYRMFANINDPATGSCGRFELATVPVSDVIPEPMPPS
jgi:hypothetical protein